MAEIKKEKSIKTLDDTSLKDIENAIGGNLETEETLTKNEKQISTFAEKSAEAAATTALKAVINTNSEIAIREAEKTYFIEKNKFMLNKCKDDVKVTRTISKLYAPIIGRVYTFNYNCIPVTIYCDGKAHEYPKFIAEKIDEKLAKISESNTYKEVIDERLDQDTY